MEYIEKTVPGTEYIKGDDEEAIHYLVAVGNVRGVPVFSDPSTFLEKEREEEPDNPDDNPPEEEEESPCVTGLSAEMISPNTVVFEWDRPADMDSKVPAGVNISDEEKMLASITGIRISTEDGAWTYIDIDEPGAVTEPTRFTTLEKKERYRAVLKYYLFDPNVVYNVQIRTKNNTEWCESDSIWWIDSFKWLSNRWSDGSVDRYASPLFLAHVYRYRNTSELSRLVHVRAGDFLDAEQQEKLVTALSEYYYQQDNYLTVLNSYFGNTYIKRSINGEEKTIPATEAISSVITVSDLIIYPNPLKDIASINYSIETAAGGFNKNPTAINGFSNISVEPTKCMLEKPFYDRYCEGYDTIGYNFYIEPGSASVNGSSVLPFTTSGAYIFKVLITPTVGNPIVLTYNINVRS